MVANSHFFQKYDVPGPRYTSYPTVPYWADSPTQDQWIQRIAQSLDKSEKEGIGAALYIHIPYCESLCTYCGCNTRITRNHSVGNPYVQSVLKEWRLYQKLLNKKITLSEIHLGGGTPTFLSSQELIDLIEGICEGVQVTSPAEFSIEADPRVTTRDQLEALYKRGFKRLSLGIQDFDPKVQEIVHRIQSEEQVREITAQARDIGYESINYDLIYGLPLQTLQSVENTIQVVRRLRPDRIAFYAYAHVPWIKPGQRRFSEADVPAGNSKRALYELGRTLLIEEGYLEIGMDHFALQTDSLWKAREEQTLHRNFMGYTARRVAPLIGLGVSAIGDSWTAFAQNEKLVEVYQSRVEKGEIPIFRGHLLSEEDRIIRGQILNLMTRMKTEWTDEESQLVPHLKQVHDQLHEFESDGLVRLTPRGCQITEQGHPFMRNICMAFDTRMVKGTQKAQLFSRTI